MTVLLEPLLHKQLLPFEYQVQCVKPVATASGLCNKEEVVQRKADVAALSVPYSVVSVKGLCNTRHDSAFFGSFWKL
ncbi:hypothetical protein VNO80_26013 [Phaseolus coccineus]|uniref:Uncharacterized protein n=1 Tax=Phaseolus coccineus TaxID=3886 RepID=A0AAN9LVW4_PHACN